MFKTAEITVRKNKAYLATWGQIENNGPLIAIEPVHIVNLSKDEVIQAVQTVLDFGHPQLPERSQEDVKQHQKKILKAYKVKSWKGLYKQAASYSIVWAEDKIDLYIAHPDKKGQMSSQPTDQKSFAFNKPLEEIVDVILEDIATVPELLSE